MDYYLNIVCILWLIAFVAVIRCREVDSSIGNKNAFQRTGDVGYRIETYSRCTVPCGGGLQTAVFVCYDKTSSTTVRFSQCQHLQAPTQYQRKCNTRPCLASWSKGTWSPCSKSCGQGTMTRSVKCVDNKNQRRKSAWKCAHFKVPQRTRLCGNADCDPEFSIGTWTECSSRCGSGTKHRSVLCQQTLANGTLSSLAFSRCSGMVPAKSMPCRDFTGCDVQGDTPIDQEMDDGESDASGSGEGEKIGGKNAPKIQLSMRKTFFLKKVGKISVDVGSKVYAVKRSEITVSCKALGDSRSPPTITWSRDGYEVTEYFEDDVGIDINGDLKIRKADRFNEGVYLCHAKSDEGGVSTATFELKILLVNKPFILADNTKASFGPGETSVQVTVGGTVTVYTGTTLTIKCPVIGKPNPTVYWLSQGRPISVGQAKSVGNNLVIESVNKIYALKYSCNARSRLGKAQAFTDVKVLDLTPPKIAAVIKTITTPQSSNNIKITIGTNITVVAGVTLTIACPISTKPTPLITWTAHGDTITGKSSQISASSDKSHIVIKRMKVQYTGLFSCSAKNAAGTSSEVSYVKVLPPTKPSIKSKKGFRSSLEKDRLLSVTIGEEATGLVGISVQFACFANGLPVPTIAWQINRKTVSNTDQRYSIKRQTLLIKKLAKEHNGEVVCVAKNRVGRATSSSKVNVITGKKPQIASKKGRVTGSEGVEEASITIGQDLRVVGGLIFRVQCPVTGFPTPRVTWSRNDHDVQSSQRILIDKNNNDLIINGIQKEDTGQYMCTAVNPLGEARESSFVSIIDEKSVSIVIGDAKLDTSSTNKPVTIRVGDSLSVLSGTDVTIKCPVKGIPVPYVLWRYKGERIESGDRKGQFRLQNGNTVLKIAQVQDDVSGQYECIATNLGGADRATSTITVVSSVAPTVDYISVRQEELQDLSMVKSTIGASVFMLAGATLTITCPAKGVPRPSYRWTGNGRPIKHGGRYAVIGNTLVVNQTKPSDSGRYFCIASNVVGKDQRFSDVRISAPIMPRIQGSPRNIEVQVQGPINSDVGSMIRSVEGASLILTCKAKGLPKPKVQWKFGEIVVAGESLKLPKLNPGDSKKYTCEASNLKGVHRKTTSLTVLAIRKPYIMKSKETIQSLDKITPITTIIGQTVTVIQGSVVTIVCNITGYPTPVVTWTQKSILIQNLKDKRGFSGKRINMTHYLLIIDTRVRTTDFTNSYECSASNIGGSDTASTELTVKAPTKAAIGSTITTGSLGHVKSLSSRDPLTITIGDNAELLTKTELTILCPVAGLPRPKVVWWAGRRRITRSKKYSLGRGTDLIIGSDDSPTTVFDSMRYACIASNLLGQDRAFSKVRFIEPKAPKILTVSGHFNFPINASFVLTIGSSVRAVTGSVLTLTCDASGLPNPELVWTKDDLIIKANGTRLIISGTKKTDSGVYECTATNLAGSKSERSVIKIEEIKEKTEKPKIFKSNQSLIASENKVSFTYVIGANITILEGKDLVLQCPTVGLPKPKVTWMFNNTPVVESDTLSVDPLTGAITIIEMTKEETGLYECVSRNVAGEDIAITYAIVVGPKVPKIKHTSNTIVHLDPKLQPIRINIGDSLTTFKGTRVSINCPSTGFPDPRIQWIHNDLSLTPQRSVILNGSMVMLTNPEGRDSGRYTCVASNPGGAQNASSNVTFLVPEAPKITTKPENVEYLKRGTVKLHIGSNLKVLEGDRIEFLCDVTGVPKPVLSWKKDRMVLRFSGSRLVVNNIRVRDSGRVICEARNYFGKDTKTSQITVVAGKKPSIKVSKTSVTEISKFVNASGNIGASFKLLERSTVKILCTATGIPKPSYSWSHNNKPIVNSERVSYDNSTGLLEIKDITVKDSGTFTCIAANVIGSDRRDSTLSISAIKASIIDVSSKRINTTASPSISAKIGDTVYTLVNTTITIACPVKGFPLPVTSWTHNGASATGSRLSIKGYKLTVAKAQIGDEGVYTCKARNPGGEVTAKSQVFLNAGIKPSIASRDDVIFDQSGFIQSKATIGGPISLLSGSSLRLHCPVSGLPVPDVSWQVDGRRLTAGPGVVIDKVNYALAITRLNRGHSNRVISCSAVNTLGAVSASSSLTVTDPIKPQIIKSKAQLVQLDTQKPVSLPIGSTIRILSGTALALRCKAKGLPKPEITWALANIPVTSEGHVTFDNDTLSISNAEKEYGGKYACKATNPVGMDTASSTVTVNEIFGPTIDSSSKVFNTIDNTKPVNMKIGANLTALSSTTITIDCTATGLPVPVTSFTKDGAIINKDHVIVQGSKLIITKARFADGGVYACRAKSLAGDVTVTSHITVIAGQRPIISTSEEVESYLQGFTNLTITVGASISILSGSGIRLLCPVRGVPKPVVSWRVRSKAKRNRAVFDQASNSLTIPRLSPLDFGNYICTAKNILGETSTSSAVNVIEPFGPKIDSSKQSIAVLKMNVPAKIRIGAKVRVLAGVTLSILCKAVGLPNPNITWTLDGRPLVTQNHVTVKGEVLEIVNSGAEDSGSYVCTASSAMGEDTATTVLTVQSGKTARITTAGRKLSLLTGLTKSTSYIGDNVTILQSSELSIMCPTEGIPEPTVSFLYNGKPLVSSGRITVNVKAKVVRIKDLKIKDSGTFTCEARNVRGKDSKSTVLDVLVPFGPTIKTSDKAIDGLKSTKPISLRIGSSVTALVNASIIVYCEVSGLPIPKVFWTKDGKSITSSGHVTVEKDTVTINKALLSDQGVYTCTAHSDVGSVSGVSKVTIKKPIPPSIKSSNKTINSLTHKPLGVIIGETVNTLTRIEFNITCEVEGLPQPEIVWKRNGVELPADGRTLINGPIIYISGLLATDTGFYVCEAKNVAGNKTVVSKLNIQEPIQPQISSTDERKLHDLRPVTLTTEVGTFIKTLETSNVTLTCSATGFPPPIITWKKGITTLEATGNSTYNIHNARVSDTGIYTCTASNLQGFDTRTSNVTIVAPSVPIIHTALQNLNVLRLETVTTNIGKPVSTLTSNAITIICNATGVPSPSLQWYKDNKMIENSNNTFKIKSAQRSDSGIYSCVAKNLAGVTKASTNLTILDGKAPTILTSNKTITKTTQVSYIVTKVGGVINTLLSANVEIKCEASGFPPPNVTWYKDDKEVRKDPTILVNKKGTLMFVSIALRRAGIYKCVANNPLGSATAFTALNVNALKHPHINSSRGIIKNLKTRDHQRIFIGQDLTVLSGSNISITCPAGGIPIPEVEWKTGDDKILPADRFSVYGRELNVVNVTKDDTGRYVCVAKNIMGKISHSSNLNVIDPKKPTIHKIYDTKKITTRKPVNASIGSKITTIPGNKLTLTCNASGIPEPKIMWKRNELFAQQGGSTYEISSLQTADTGVYTCIASNLAGEVTATSHLIVLVGSKPEIITPKLNVKATEGENDAAVDVGGNLTTIVGTGVEIHCKVKGLPRPTITWLLNGSLVLTTSVRFANVEKNDLVLLGVTLDDIGIYTCYANNTFGQASETTFLNVFAAKGPVIRFTKRKIEDFNRQNFKLTVGDSLSTLIGTTVTIDCNATGNPPPEITWTKSGSPLPKTRQFKVTNNTLKIHVSSWSDTGQYECTAMNAAGSDRKTSFVKFAPPEKPVISQNTTIIEIYDRKPVTMVIGSTLKTLTQTPITIKCTATGLSTPSYTWSKNSAPIKSSRKFQVSQGGKELTLRDVTMDDSGIYRCTATNKAGKDTAKSPILLTEPALPKIIFTDENITWYDRLPVSARVGGDIIALTGTQVTLTCKALGFPEPSVSWRLGDETRQLDTDGQYKLENDSLVIFAVQPSDSNKYKCVATNLAGNVQSRTNLKVIDPEEPVIQISNNIIRTEDRLPVVATIGDRIVVVSGTTVSIQCPVKGIPVPSVSWSNGGKFLQPKDRLRTLELVNTTSTSSGEYTCTAISPIGGDVASSTLLVADPIKPIIETSISNVIQISNKTLVNITIPDRVSVFVGTTVVIRCPAIGIPKPTITWEKDGVKITTPSAVDTLTVKTSKISDGGVFVCVAENPAGVVRGNSTIDVLEQFAPRVNSKTGLINALDKPQKTYATIGQNIKTLTMTSVILQCPATGSPTPSVTWSKSGQLIISGERVTVTKAGELVIEKGRTTDSGDYTCTARSVLGKDAVVSTIIIMNPTRPEISKSTGYIIWYEHLPFKSKIGKNLTTMKGRKLTLICPARGMPRPEVTWYRGGERMQNEDNIVIQGDTLIISDLTVFDTDRYTCVAQNYVGADAATSTLKVHDPVVPHIFSSTGFINALSGYNLVNATVGQDVIAPVKSEVKLICPYKGVPRPKILWIKDHQAVVSDDTIEVDCNGTLKFHGIRARDAGEFVCYVESFLGMDMALTHVKLVERSTPVIQKSNNIIPISDKSKVTAVIGDNVTALQTQTIEVKCNATGIPYPVITWTRNGVEIKSVGMYSIDKKGTLTIRGAGRDGLYKCTAKNDQGSDSEISKIIVKEPKRPETISPRKPKNIPFTHHKNVTINIRDNVTALPGSNLTIRCHVVGVPDPIVTWFKDGNVTLSKGKDNSLVIRNAKESDSGRYTCKAENIRGSVTATSDVIINKPVKPVIDVPIEPRNIPPKGIDHVTLSVGENVTSLVGSRIMIDCEADGDPTPMITWTKEAKVINTGSDAFVLHSNGSLEITMATARHTGRYVCTARNDGGQDSEEVYVNIIEPQKPKITTPEQPTTISKQDQTPVTMTIGDKVTALTNTSISIDCVARGIPEPTITWSKNGQELNDRGGYMVYSNGTLVIVKTGLNDGGKYICTARNIGGEDSVTSSVTIIEPTKPRITWPDKPNTIPPGPVGSVNSTIGDNITTLVDSNITINCPAVGVPPPKWTWSKDGEAISVGKKFSIGKGGALVIRKVTVDESGSYRCTVENIAGIVTAVTRILSQVPEEPKITRPQKPTTISAKNTNPINMTVGSNITSLTNTPIRINCLASGLPLPTIKWMKDGVEVVLKDGYRVDKDGSLVIENAKVKDSGRYTCEAVNVQGQDKESSTVKVIVPSKPNIKTRNPPITITAKDKSPVEIIIGDKLTSLTGSTVAIHCDAVAVPEAQITWFKDNQLLQPGNGYAMYGNGTLVVDISSTSQRGIYTCKATNHFGTDSKNSIMDVLVPRKPEILKPTKPTEISAKNRDPVSMNITDNIKTFTFTNVTITCASTGLPKPTISWLFNGKPLSDDPRYKVFDNGTIVVHNMIKSDEGKYTCIAKNIEGEDSESSNIDITVPIKPKINRKPSKNIPIGDGGPTQIDIGSNVTTIPNTPINITCQATGLPKPDITWYKGGREVNPVLDRSKVLPDGTLVLRESRVDNTGVYTCKATNIDGEDTASTVLTVVPSQKPTIERPVSPQNIITQVELSRPIRITDNITITPGRTVSITCKSRGVPTPQVTWYKDGDVIEKEFVSANGTLTLRDIRENQSGKYTCMAKNRIGVDSATSKVLIMPLSKPSIQRSSVSIPTNLTNTNPHTTTIGGIVNGFPGTPITIKCTATGAPTPVIKWLKDGAEIKPGSRYTMNRDKSLVISKTVRQDRGRYTCVASNLVGSDSADTVINMLIPTKPRITRPTVKSIESMDMHTIIKAGVGASVTTLADNTIVLDCTATGFPDPKIIWNKDLEPIKTGEFYQILANNSLVIPKAKVEDVGIYTCTARNSFGQDKLSSSVEIIEAEVPVIQRTAEVVDKQDFNEIETNIGNSVTTLSRVNITVNCSARGVPTPTIEWTNGKKMLNVKGPMLKLENVDRSITGMYTCIASNVAGNATASTMIHVNEPITPVIHKTKKELVVHKVTSLSSNVGGSIETLVGSNLLLVCNATGFPRPQVKWSKSGTTLPKDRRYIISNGNLKIFGVKLDDSSAITCTATNLVGEDSATTEITIKGLLRPFISVEKKQIKNFDKTQPIQVAVGNNLITGPGAVVVVSCPVSARPKATLTWQRKGVPINPSLKYRFSPDKSKLTILGVDFVDAGAYVCTAFNRAGTDFASMDMIVATPPIITNVRGSFDVTDIRELISITTGAVVTIPRGVSIKIRCDTTGTPTPNITWFRVPEGTKIRQRINHNNKDTFIDQDGFLSIERTNELDIAKYVCVATNIAGRDEGVTHLNVGVVPDIPGQWSAARKFTKPRIERVESMATVVRGSVVRLRCAVYGSPKPRITWIVVGNERKDHWRILPDGTLEIPKVDFSDEGNYTCIASNSYGRTFRSTNLTVLVPPKILDKFFSEPFIKEKVALLNIKYSSVTRLGVKRQTTRPTAVENGRNLLIGCPVMGRPEPTILWLRNGLKVRNDSKHFITGGVLMIRSVSSADAGEYFCFVRNTAGEDGGGIDLHIRSKIIGRWFATPWSECENCYENFKGYRTRTVNCVDDKNNTVPVSYCNDLSQPIAKKNCRARNCEAIWVSKKWATCSALCGSKGTHTRDVSCVYYKSIRPAARHQCLAVKPKTSEPCNRLPCEQNVCKDIVNYCKQIKERGLCTAFKQYCCFTCGGNPSIYQSKLKK